MGGRSAQPSPLNCGSGVVRWCAHPLLTLFSIQGGYGALGGSPQTPGMAGHCLVTFGGHTHTTTTTFGVADTVFDCGSGVVRWCARHPQHLGSPWGIGGNAFTPQGWQGTPWPSYLTEPTHPTMAALGVADICIRISNCGSGVLWWGAHHQVHLRATLRLKALPPHFRKDRALHRSP
jgi:hypothetical protein